MKLKDGFQGSRSIVLPISVVKELETDILGRDLRITDIGYYPNAKYHFRQRLQGIKQYILLYCVSGKGWYRINNVKFELNENQYVILPANVSHEYGSNNNTPWTIYWIHFEGLKASFFANGLSTPHTVSPDVDSRIEDRIEMFEELYHILEMGYGKENLYYCITCFFHFIGSLIYLGQYRNVKRKGGQKDIIDLAIHFMHENMDKKLSLEEIAKEINYSPSYFSTTFKNKTGYSPLNYFTHLKITKACELLDLYDLKINQICPQLGFDDVFYFSRVFKKVTGISPTKFKMRER